MTVRSLLEWDKLFKQAFRCFTKPEDKLHLQVAQYLRFDYPELLWWHTQNEAKRTPIARLRALCFGNQPGVPDIVIPFPQKFKVRLEEDVFIETNYYYTANTIFAFRPEANNLIEVTLRYVGFFCELKAEYPTTVQRKAGPKTVMIKNKETPEQEKVRHQLEALGYYCCVCYSLDEFKQEWENYLG